MFRARFNNSFFAVGIAVVIGLVQACSPGTMGERSAIYGDSQDFEQSLIASGLRPLDEQELIALHSNTTMYLRFPKTNVNWVEYYGPGGVAAILAAADYPEQGLKKGDVAHGAWWTEGNRFCVDYREFGLAKPVCLRVYEKSRDRVLYIRVENMRHGPAGSLSAYTLDVRKGNAEHYPMPGTAINLRGLRSARM